MRACRNDKLGLLEIICQALALFPCQNIFKPRHVLVFLMFDMLMEVFQEGTEKREEVFAVRRHVLELVEVFLYLVAVSQGLVLSQHDTIYRHMLLTVHIGQLSSLLAQLLLHDWVQGQFLAHSMACESPGELVPPLNFLLQGTSSLEVLSICVDSTMVSTDGFGDGTLILVVGRIA